MEVREGYKLTELGVIPEEWDVNSFEQICRVNQGLQIAIDRRKKYPTSNSRVYITVQYLNSDDAPEYIDDYSSSVCCEPDNILMTRTGNTGIVVTGETGVFHNNFFKILFNREKINSGFFVYYLRSHDCQKTILEKAGTSTIPDLNHGDFYSIQIALPSFIEQHAIATALSDMDALLEGLDQLIAKKRDLKQATMQQLLTGKTRLPGFEGEWEVKLLGNHIKFLRNGVNSRAELTIDEPVKYLHYGDIHGWEGVTITPVDFPSLPAVKAKTLDRLRNGDLVFADASEDIEGVGKSVEIFGVGNIEVVAGLHTIAVRFDESVLANGFKAYLKFCPEFIRHIRKLAAGTKVYATNRAHIASVEMKLPDVKEQIAIATILSDMDAEIEALQQRRTKTRDLKQAMMQELLTGRTRLVKPGGSANG